MYYIYILQNIKHNRFYTGSTGDLLKRLAKHNSGRVKSTKPYKPWKMIHSEEFPDRISARRREYQLKKNYQARKSVFDKIKE